MYSSNKPLATAFDFQCMQSQQGVAHDVHSSQVATMYLAKYWSSSKKITVMELVALFVCIR